MIRRSQMDSRLVRGQERMAPGSLGGRSEQAQPVPRAPRAQAYRSSTGAARESIVFGSIGDVVVADSGEYEVLVGGSGMRVIVNFTAALTGSSAFTVKVDGVTAGSVTVASGQTRAEDSFDVATQVGDIVTLSSTSVGTGSAVATVQVVLV